MNVEAVTRGIRLGRMIPGGLFGRLVGCGGLAEEDISSSGSETK